MAATTLVSQPVHAPGFVQRAGADKKRAKRLKALEADLSRATLNLNKGRSQGFALVQSLLFMGLAWTLGSVLKGVVVAKIPFEPPAIFTKMTHRLIEGDDMTDCAYAAIYMLAGMAIKPSITRLLRCAPPLPSCATHASRRPSRPMTPLADDASPSSPPQLRCEAGGPEPEPLRAGHVNGAGAEVKIHGC